jgi:hypothetical protein
MIWIGLDAFLDSSALFDNQKALTYPHLLFSPSESTCCCVLLLMDLLHGTYWPIPEGALQSLLHLQLLALGLDLFL